MIRSLGYSALFACMIILSACASKPEKAAEVLTPMPDVYAVRDPSDDVLMSAVSDYLKEKSAPAQSQYEFTRVDLDGDGRREGLVLMNSPHEYWCGSDGCDMIVLKARNDGFTLASEIMPVRGPLRVSNAVTNGWRDLIVRVSGRFDIQTKDVALQFGQAGYPSQPQAQPPMQAYASNDTGGVQIFP
jgi:hypothetical protein